MKIDASKGEIVTKINDYVIKPDETFSFTETVGKATTEAGYQKATAELSRMVKLLRTGEKKVAAHIVEKEAYTIDMLSVEISTATTVTRPDVKAVIDALVDISMRHLCEGHRVELGTLGKLYPTIRCTPTKYLEDIESGIKGVSARFQAGTQLTENLKAVSYTMVAQKSDRDSALEGRRESIYSVVGRKPKPEPDDDEDGD